MSSISASRSSSRLRKYSGDSFVKLVCRNVPSTIVFTIALISTCHSLAGGKKAQSTCPVRRLTASGNYFRVAEEVSHGAAQRFPEDFCGASVPQCSAVNVRFISGCDCRVRRHLHRHERRSEEHTSELQSR